MGWQELLAGALILAGASMLVFALGSALVVLRLLGRDSRARPWRLLLVLQAGSCLLYLVAGGLVVIGRPAPLLIGGLLLLASWAVLLTVRLSAHTIADLRAAVAEAQRSGVARSTFLANLSHDLRTPLTMIIGYSALLSERAARGGSPEPMGELAQIQAAGAHLLGLIDNLLDHARLEAGRLDLRLTVVDLPALIESAVETVRPLAAERGNSLSVRLDSEAPALVADEARLRQILVNLLANACQFTRGGQIALHVSHAGDELLFSVSDTGAGMSREQQQRLFKPFVQATGHTVPRYGGTGLGLTIAQQLAQLMGGEIGVVSAPGRGSTFTLRLPAATADLTPASLRAAPPLRSGEGAGGEVAHGPGHAT